MTLIICYYLIPLFTLYMRIKMLTISIHKMLIYTLTMHENSVYKYIHIYSCIHLHASVASRHTYYSYVYKMTARISKHI